MFDAGTEIARNRALWTQVNAEFTDAAALRAWTAESITWGLFNCPEDELGALGNVADLDVVELGCGTAYFAAWLARRGARPVGVDVTPAQLATARRCQEQLNLSFSLIEASAEAVPLRDNLFDLVLSEYGASLWCDPARWVPEAARLLKPGGRLVFLTNSVLATLTVPPESGFAEERLLRFQRDIYRTEWPGGGIEYHPSHGEWVRILRANGFEVEALHELYPPANADTHQYYEIVTQEWAQRWPAEDLWEARLTGGQADDQGAHAGGDGGSAGPDGLGGPAAGDKLSVPAQDR
jgi:SAM-dependent methyltransferase